MVRDDVDQYKAAVGWGSRSLFGGALSERGPEEPLFGLGNLRIERRLGEGGFSTVFLATDTLLNRLIAIKILKQQVQGQSVRDRFVRECAAVGRLTHPHIIRIYDAGFLQDERPYLTMEYAPAGDFDSLLATGPIKAQDAVALIVQVADALAYTHRLGIVHGDVKPANILLIDKRYAVLGDFGVARFISESADENSVSMSIPWAAPELIKREAPPSPAQDVYSLGATLYHAVVGQPPSVPSSLRQNLARIKDDVSSSDPGLGHVDPHLRFLISKAMAPDPRQRPSMQDMAYALSSYAAENAVALPATPPAYSEVDETAPRDQDVRPLHTVDRDISALLDIPQSAGSHTVIRKAAAIEERREAREYRRSGAVVSVTTVIVSLLSVVASVYEAIPVGHSSRLTTLVSASSVVAAILVVLMTSYVWRVVDRRRERTLRFRTLESAARVRSAYVRALRLSALAPHGRDGGTPA